MNSIELTSNRKQQFAAFIWQHTLLLISLFIMTLGVALCVRSNLGSSVISSVPLAFTLAGAEKMSPALSLGDYTNILNAILVAGQIAVLRRRFEAVQLLQLLIGFVFGMLIDLNMALTSALVCDTIRLQALAQAAGCTVLGIGVAFEVRCGSVTMPGEGLPLAITRVSRLPFAKAKIAVDITLVVLAIAVCYAFFGRWLWNVVGPGTLFAMIYVGFVVKYMAPRIGWFDRLLGGHRRVYGLLVRIRSRI